MSNLDLPAIRRALAEAKWPPDDGANCRANELNPYELIMPGGLYPIVVMAEFYAKPLVPLVAILLNNAEALLAEIERLRQVEGAAMEMALFHGTALSTSDWFDREADLCHKRTGVWPNGKDIAGCVLERGLREEAWAEHLRLRKIELAAALDAALGGTNG